MPFVNLTAGDEPTRLKRESGHEQLLKYETWELKVWVQKSLRVF